MRFVIALLLLGGLPSLKADFPTPFNTEKTPGGPMPAEEAARTMELPPGFKCQVFAAEPDVQQPIAMAWDAKGRLWIAECYTYAEQPQRWDTKLRDRILIFEDKDNDGHFDKRTVFYDQATYLTSIEIGYGGVYLLEAGGLSFIADKNGDDVPDGPPQVLLDGFNTKTIGHNIVNGLKWGPDGWLYGRHGITDTSSIGAPGTPHEQRTKMNCGMFRYHPTKHTFEVVLNGGTNSWGHDWDANGELFWINTVINHLWHGIPGAYNDRMFGTHLNPHVYDTIKQTADHWHFDHDNEKWADVKKGISNKTDGLGGGHAHVGCVIYNGGTWPQEYQGKLFTCNLHGNRINMDILEREGCGFVAKHGKDFMKSKDTWFRGIDLSTGPDGNVFVIDWSDAGECHDNDGVHRTSGRIYKIVYDKEKSGRPTQLTQTTVDLNKKTSAELFNILSGGDSNNWWSRHASQVLRERYALDQEIPEQELGNTIANWMRGIDFGSSKSIPVLRHLNSASESLVAKLQSSENELLRMEGVKLSETLPGDPVSAFGPLATLADKEPSGLVRLHLASALQRLPLEARFPIATALASHAEDAHDRQQPLMVWYGIEPAVVPYPDKAIALALGSKLPTVTRLITRRLTEEIEKTPGPVNDLLTEAATKARNDINADILRGMIAALKGFSQVTKPKAWDAFAATMANLASADVEIKAMLRDLNLVFGSGRAADELIALVKDAEGDANARRSAFDSLLRSPKPEQYALVRGLINDKVLGTAARLGLAKFADGDVPKALLSSWPDRSQEWRAANVTTLSSRTAWVKELLAFIEKHPSAREDLTPFQARQIRNLGDDAVNQQLAKVWGELRDTPAAKQEEITKWKGLLTPDAVAKADASKGRLVFAGVCAACHKLYGEGAAIAPDLTGSDRHNIDYLLGNIVDPSALVPADYRVSVLKLKDGRTLSGVIPEQNDKVLTLQTPAERLSIQRSDIVDQQQLTQSLMPEGLLTALGEDNVKHLIAYLMSNGPVALPK